jgi:thiol:disulfide interchange protein DsbD
MDTTTFVDPDVISELDSWVIVKLDFTDMNDKNVAIAEKWGMLGLPTTVMLHLGQTSAEAKKLIGYQSGPALLRELKSFRGN